MAKGKQQAEEPARKQHRGRMGCLVIIGVVSMVIVGTVFAPDRPRGNRLLPPETPMASETPSPTTTPTRTRTAAPTVPGIAERTATPDPMAQTDEVMTAVTEIARTDVASMTAAILELPTRAPTITRTLTARTPTPTGAAGEMLFATNTLRPLVILTNTPAG